MYFMDSDTLSIIQSKLIFMGAFFDSKIGQARACSWRFLVVTV